MRRNPPIAPMPPACGIPVDKPPISPLAAPANLCPEIYLELVVQE